MPIFSMFDDNVSEALFRFVGIHKNYSDFCKANEFQDLSIAEWVYNSRLVEFNQFCIDNYEFTIKECQG